LNAAIHLAGEGSTPSRRQESLECKQMWHESEVLEEKMALLVGRQEFKREGTGRNDPAFNKNWPKKTIAGEKLRGKGRQPWWNIFLDRGATRSLKKKNRQTSGKIAF